MKSFLLTAGVGSDFSKYCGELEKRLTKVIRSTAFSKNRQIIPDSTAGIPQRTGTQENWNNIKWRKARVSVMTAISRHRSAVVSMTSKDDVEELEGRLRKIIEALKEKNIILLPGGTLERYLPSTLAMIYDIKDDAKRKAVLAEIDQMKKA